MTEDATNKFLLLYFQAHLQTNLLEYNAKLGYAMAGRDRDEYYF